MNESYTDCRSSEGITVGLIDAIIVQCRLLRERDLSPDAVQEALQDIATDEDFAYLNNLLEKLKA